MTLTQPSPSEGRKPVPEIKHRYVGEGLELYWTNPWDGSEERIASFWWPGHPIEETETVEQWFELIAEKACMATGRRRITDEELNARLGPTVADQLAGLDSTPEHADLPGLRWARDNCPACNGRGVLKFKGLESLDGPCPNCAPVRARISELEKG